MILEQKEKKFSAITITIQTRDELDMILTSLNVSEYTFKKHMTDCSTQNYNNALKSDYGELRTELWSKLVEYFD